MSGCLICGKPLLYVQNTKRKRCKICGNIFSADAFCLGGHYVCDACHGKGAIYVIRAVCKSAQTSDAWAIAREIMRSPAVETHGPEHHIIVGSALLAAYCNASESYENFEKYLEIIEKRGKKVPGGTCGFWGACGAAIGAGIFLAAVTNSTPLATETHGLCNRLTARCLAAIGEIGGPRCCKRNVALAIRETTAFLRENFGVNLGGERIICEFSTKNDECIGDRCPFANSEF
ncbi:MAG: DUF5714 domain-containing protein [Oscillospiraceae bacterium]|jgi:hypothetical protein|nr:DUF5714 domain-containing protein [Oscillospiraceae bacterium]